LAHTIDLLHVKGMSNPWLSEILTILKPYTNHLYPAIDPRLEKIFVFIQNNLAENLA
jgi:hypothetical protein